MEMVARAYELGEKSIIDFRKLFLPSDDDVECAGFHHDWDKQLREGTGHYAVEAFRESGKALALDTKVPTPDGWKIIADINPHDYVFGDDGSPVEVLGVSDVYYDHDCYRFTFDDGSVVVCDGGHLWTVLNKHHRKIETLTAAEMYEGQVLCERADGYQEKAYRVDLCNPVMYLEKKLLIDPYLLGVWLGDGDSTQAIISVWTEIIDEFTSLLVSSGADISLCSNVKSNCRRVYFKEFKCKLKALNLLSNKHIPTEYIYSSVEQRLELVRGLIDTDGSLSTKGTKAGIVEFSNTNKLIVDGLCEILGSLGIKYTVRECIAKPCGKDCGVYWKVAFKTQHKVAKLKYKDNTKYDCSPRCLKRTIKSIERVNSVPCKCLFVNNISHLFLITDRFIPTHNSQYVIRSFCLYRLVYPVEKQSYIVILKANQTEASKKLKEISTEYQSNPWLKSNLISVNEDNGRAFDVVVKDKSGNNINIRIEAYGKGSAIRGISFFNKRPHIIIADDLQDLGDSQSEAIQNDDWEWFTSDVLFLGKKTRIFMIGNNLGAACLIERVAESADRLNFTFVRIPILDEHDKSNWESYWHTEDIIAERNNQREIGNISSWMREKMCLAVAPEKQVFKREYFKYYDQSNLNLRNLSIFTTVDVAIGQKDTADYTSVCTIGVNSDNHWFLLDIDYGRKNPSEQIDAIFKAVSKWHPLTVGVEKVAYQAALEHFLIKEMPLRNIFFTIKALLAAGKKEMRIETLQPRFVAGTIWFPMGASFLTELELELLSFPKGLHDDLIDSLAYHSQIASAPVGGWGDSENSLFDIPMAGAM